MPSFRDAPGLYEAVCESESKRFLVDYWITYYTSGRSDDTPNALPMGARLVPASRRQCSISSAIR